MNKPVRLGLASATLAASLIGGAAAGLVLVPNLAGAQDDTTETPTETPSTETPSTETPADDSRPDPATRIRDALQGLVDDGTITSDQADAVATALASELPAGGPHGMGFDGPGGAGPFGDELDAVAELLGTDASELMTALRDGQTLADLAAEAGVSPDAVIDALLGDVAEHLDEEVAEGDLTQEEADARLAEITERVTDFVNNGPSADAMGGFGGHGGMGGRGGPGGRGFGGSEDGTQDGTDGGTADPGATTEEGEA